MYNEHFGFSERPFNVTSNPRFLYVNRTYQEAFTTLRYGVRLRSGLIVMTGEAGTGKTALLGMVSERFESDVHTASILKPARDFTELLRLMWLGFGLLDPPEDRVTLMRELESYLKEQLEQNNIVAVFLDEAQDLDVHTLAELTFLSDLEIDNQKLLQIVLVGRSELETKLEHPAIRPIEQRATLWCRLAPLERDEVGSYIDSQLVGVGHQGQGLFSPEAIEQISLLSKGIPRWINIICDKALLAAYSAAQKTISPEMIQKVSRDPQLLREMQSEAAAFSSPFYNRAEVVHSEPSWEEKSGEEDLKAGEIDTGDDTVRDEFIVRRERKPKQAGCVRNLRELTIPGFLAIVVLASGAAVLYFEGSERLESKNSAMGTRDEKNQGMGGKPVSEILAEKSPGGLSPIQMARSRDRLVREKTGPAARKVPDVAPKAGQGSAKVYVHASKKRDRLVLEEISDALRDKGYTTPDTRLTSGRTQGDVRFFFPQDQRDAEGVKSLVESELARRGYRISLELLERDGRKFQFAAPGKIEVWLPPLPDSG